MQAVLGGTAAAAMPDPAQVICASAADTDDGSSEPHPVEVHHLCRTAAAGLDAASPPLVPTTTIAWPQRPVSIVAWRPEVVAAPRAPPGVSPSARAPPVIRSIVLHSILSEHGFPTCTPPECPRDLDVLFVPGGLLGSVDRTKKPAVVDFLAEGAERARFVTSVRTGDQMLGLVASYGVTGPPRSGAWLTCCPSWARSGPTRAWSMTATV